MLNPIRSVLNPSGRFSTQSGRCSTHLRSVLNPSHPHLILLPARAHSEHEASREQALHVDGPSLCCNQRGHHSLSSSLSVLGQRRRQRRPDSQLVLPPWSVVRGSSSRGISNARLFLPALFFSCSLALWVGTSPRVIGWAVHPLLEV